MFPVNKGDQIVFPIGMPGHFTVESITAVGKPDEYSVTVYGSRGVLLVSGSYLTRIKQPKLTISVESDGRVNLLPPQYERMLEDVDYKIDFLKAVVTSKYFKEKATLYLDDNEVGLITEDGITLWHSFYFTVGEN